MNSCLHKKNPINLVGKNEFHFFMMFFTCELISNQFSWNKENDLVRVFLYEKLSPLSHSNECSHLKVGSTNPISAQFFH